MGTRIIVILTNPNGNISVDDFFLRQCVLSNPEFPQGYRDAYAAVKAAFPVVQNSDADAPLYEVINASNVKQTITSPDTVAAWEAIATDPITLTHLANMNAYYASKGFVQQRSYEEF